MGSLASSRRCRFAWLTILAAGMVFGSSCGVAEIRAISAGITAATSTIDHRNDNISFSDWLRDELRNL